MAIYRGDKMYHLVSCRGALGRLAWSRMALYWDLANCLQSKRQLVVSATSASFRVTSEHWYRCPWKSRFSSGILLLKSVNGVLSLVRFRRKDTDNWVIHMKGSLRFLCCLVVLCFSSFLAGCGNTTPSGKALSPRKTVPTDTTPVAEKVTVIQHAFQIPVYPLTIPPEYAHFPEVDVKGLPSFYKEPPSLQQGVATADSPHIVIHTGQVLLVTYPNTSSLLQTTSSGTPTVESFTIRQFEVCNQERSVAVGVGEEYALITAKDVGRMIAFWIVRDNSGSGDVFSPRETYGLTLVDLQPFYPYPVGMTVSGPFTDPGGPPKTVPTNCNAL